MSVRKLLTGMALSWALNATFKTPIEKDKPRDGWYFSFSNDSNGDVHIHADYHTPAKQTFGIAVNLSHAWEEVEKWIKENNSRS